MWSWDDDKLERISGFKLWMCVGGRSNMRAKLLSLWGLLWFVRSLWVSHIEIVGDSKTVIDQLNGVSTLFSLSLDHWMRRIRCLIREFTYINFRHIYREYNIEANCLSKLLIGAMDGFLFVEEYIDGFLFASGSLNLF